MATAIDGSNFVPLSEAAATAMQEKASLVVIKEGINKNKVFTREEIVEGKGTTGKAIQKKIFHLQKVLELTLILINILTK